MKLLFNILSAFGLSFAYPAIVLAHESGAVHEEPPASIDPIVAVIVVVVIAVGVFLVWKFLLKGESTTDKK